MDTKLAVGLAGRPRSNAVEEAHPTRSASGCNCGTLPGTRRSPRALSPVANTSSGAGSRFKLSFGPRLDSRQANLDWLEGDVLRLTFDPAARVGLAKLGGGERREAVESPQVELNSQAPPLGRPRSMTPESHLLSFPSLQVHLL